MSSNLWIEYRSTVKISEDEAMTQKALDWDHKQKFQQYKQSIGGRVEVPGGTTDLELPVGGITDIQFIVLRASAQMSVKLGNIANTPIVVRPNPTNGAVAEFILETSGIDALFVSTPSGDVVSVWYHVAGNTA